MAAKKKRVLIVEDAQDVARLISSALESVNPNLKIIICPSAEEAMLESAREPAQLLITDIRLPGISGTDMVRKIGARNPAMKVILITGLTAAQVGRQMDGIQVEAFFRKPFEITELIAVAERCLNAADVPASAQQPAKQETLELRPPRKTGMLNDLGRALSELRQSTNALSVVLLNPSGTVAAQAGEFPGGSFEQEWAPLVQEALAGHKRLAERLDAGAPQTTLTARGKAFDLLIAPAQAYILVLALKPQPSSLRAALALEEASRLQPRMEAGLQNLPPAAAPPPTVVQVAPPAKAVQAGPPERASAVPAPAVVERPKPVEEALPPKESTDGELNDLAALFDSSGAAIKSVDVNAFWELLAESSAIEPLGKDSISFEKARKLGLVSDLGE